jgi:hypothetical protein
MAPYSFKIWLVVVLKTFQVNKLKDFLVLDRMPSPKGRFRFSTDKRNQVAMMQDAKLSWRLLFHIHIVKLGFNELGYSQQKNIMVKNAIKLFLCVKERVYFRLFTIQCIVQREFKSEKGKWSTRRKPSRHVV